MFGNISSKMTERMFRKVDNLVIDITTGKVGYRTSQGIATLDRTAGSEAHGNVAAVPESFGVSINPFDQMGLSMPGFAFNTPFDKINIGDFIHGAGDVLGWVTKKHPRSFELLKPNGTHSTYTPPTTSIMDFGRGALVVQSFGSMFGGEEGATGMQGALMPLLMMSGEGGLGDMESILPFILMQGIGGGAGAAGGMMQGLMPMLMMSKLGGAGGGLDMKSLLPMIMMGGMGSSGNNMQGMMMAMMLSKDEAPTPQAITGRARQLVPPLQRSSNGW